MSDLWIKYPHVERLDSEEVTGLFDLEDLWIEPKIDGANASVLWDNGSLLVAKRSGLLDQEEDFRGLRAYVYTQQDRYLEFFKDYPKAIIYGEWLVKHTVNYYRESAWNHLYAFDVLEDGEFWEPSKRVDILGNLSIQQITPICCLKGPLLDPQVLHKYLNQNKFLIDEPDKSGEGIVIKGFQGGRAFRNKFGRTCWTKIVRQEFKEKNAIEFGSPKHELKGEPEKLFVDQFITSGRVEKLKQKILSDKETGWRTEYIGELLGRTWFDAFSEELWGFVKKGKIKGFDFRLAQRLCILKTKQLIGL